MQNLLTWFSQILTDRWWHTSHGRNH